ncbi:hypothetical protein KC219_21695, partial [Mycobacterium tuberculosis]|nr:hypothetical protein [Mycobacterium tuberculosis]
MEAHKLVASMRMGAAADAYYDWQGGLIWMRRDGEPEAEAVRALIRKYGGGHATLVRAPDGIDGERFFQKHSAALKLQGITQLD